jgi:signal transduction histidine kinase
LEIKVNDWGKGIAETDFTKIFEPFFTTKKSKSLGIGLAIVKQYVAEDFKGALAVKSSRHGGTCFTVRLPVKNSVK